MPSILNFFYNFFTLSNFYFFGILLHFDILLNASPSFHFELCEFSYQIFIIYKIQAALVVYFSDLWGLPVCGKREFSANFDVVVKTFITLWLY